MVDKVKIDLDRWQQINDENKELKERFDAIKKGGICAVKPIPNLAEKRVDFVLIKGKKGKGNSIQTPDGDYDPDEFSTMSRGIAKCPNCNNLIQTENLLFKEVFL